MNKLGQYPDDPAAAINFMLLHFLQALFCGSFGIIVKQWEGDFLQTQLVAFVQSILSLCLKPTTRVVPDTFGIGLLGRARSLASAEEEEEEEEEVEFALDNEEIDFLVALRSLPCSGSVKLPPSKSWALV